MIHYRYTHIYLHIFHPYFIHRSFSFVWRLRSLLVDALKDVVITWIPIFLGFSWKDGGKKSRSIWGNRGFVDFFYHRWRDDFHIFPIFSEVLWWKPASKKGMNHENSWWTIRWRTDEMNIKYAIVTAPAHKKSMCVARDLRLAKPCFWWRRL